jgi:hypothetical protein
MPLLEGQGSEYHGITFSERRRFSNQPPPLAFPEMSDPGVVTEGCELYEREDLRQAYIRGLIRADLAHNFEIGDAYAVSDERYTLIHRTALGDQFFDRLTDPCELKNLIADESAAEARLRTKLDAILAALASSTRSADLIDPEEIERLKALGYTP